MGDLKKILEEARAKKAALMRFLTEGGEKPFEAKTSFGHVVAHRDPREPGKPWRLTFFTAGEREPDGHTNFTSFKELVSELPAYGVHSPEGIKRSGPWSRNPRRHSFRTELNNPRAEKPYPLPEERLIMTNPEAKADKFHDVFGVPYEAHLVPVWPRKRKLEGHRIAGAKDVVAYMRGAVSSPQERIYVLLMNQRNEIMGVVMATQGTINASVVAPREIFAAALAARAVSIVIVHNHPSGDPTPSEADRRLTRVLMQAGEVLDIPVLDHIVLGSDGRYTSLQAAGLMPDSRGRVGETQIARMNPWIKHRDVPALRHDIEQPPPGTMKIVKGLSKRYDALAKKIDDAYEAGRPDIAERLEPKAAEIEAQLSGLYYGLEEGSDSEGFGVQSDVEEQLVARYRDFLNGGQIFNSRSEADLADGVRSVLEGGGANFGAVRAAAQQQLVDAAKDAYEQRERLLSRYRSKARRSNPLDPACMQIGKAYLAAPDVSGTERARRLYAQYSVETGRLFDLIRLKVEFTTADPYKTAADMLDQVSRTGVMRIYSGGNDHPLRSETANLKGRAVHDLLAHLVCGCPFTATGEFNAFEAQAALYSVDIRPLLFTEIVGQTCAYIAQGERHAEQKVLFLPERLEEAAQGMRKRFRGLGLAGVIERGWIDPKVLEIAERTGYALRYLYAVLENKPVVASNPSDTNTGWTKGAVRTVAPLWGRWL